MAAPPMGRRYKEINQVPRTGIFSAFGQRLRTAGLAVRLPSMRQLERWRTAAWARPSSTTHHASTASCQAGH